MRSLVLKLTLAFLLVAVTGVLIFAALVGGQTQGEFLRFLSGRDQAALVSALANYYQQHNSWAGVDANLAADPQLNFYRQSAALFDPHAIVVLGHTPYVVGQQVSPQEIDESTAVRAGGQVVGYVHFAPIVSGTTGPFSGDGPRPAATESAFLNRVVQAALTSAGIAALIAALIGIVLARTLTKPVRALTVATKAMAAGQLDQQVVVHSRDELGELAQSFNQMSRDLAQASQSRKQLTADLAHDLRTPLTILRGYTEGLLEGRLEGSPKLFGIMHGEVDHLQRLVDDLRTLSLADAGEMRLYKRSVDPKALLERTALAYMVQAEQQGIALRVDAPDNLPSISADTMRMTQVLNNLVSNALRHTTQGEVVLAAKRVEPGQKVALSVCDTGTGIAPEDLPFVFDRFYRADKSRQRVKNSEDSSGLGLAIAKAIIEAHGGNIWVESSAGRGATFTMSL